MSDTNEPSHLKLESVCTLREAADLHFALLAADASASPFRINGGAVDRIDTAGLQLLTSFIRQRSGSGVEVTWSATSAELTRCANRLGLQAELRLPAVAKAGE